MNKRKHPDDATDCTGLNSDSCSTLQDTDYKHTVENIDLNYFISLEQTYYQSMPIERWIELLKESYRAYYDKHGHNFPPLSDWCSWFLWDMKKFALAKSCFKSLGDGDLTLGRKRYEERFPTIREMLVRKSASNKYDIFEYNRDFCEYFRLLQTPIVLLCDNWNSNSNNIAIVCPIYQMQFECFVTDYVFPVGDLADGIALEFVLHDIKCKGTGESFKECYPEEFAKWNPVPQSMLVLHTTCEGDPVRIESKLIRDRQEVQVGAVVYDSDHKRHQVEAFYMQSVVFSHVQDFERHLLNIIKSYMWQDVKRTNSEQ